MNDLLRTSSTTGNLLHDAHTAALLVEQGVDEILTAGEGFRRFPRLKVSNPCTADSPRRVWATSN